MGHLSRCLSYARQLQGKAQIVFFSMASAINVIEEMGFAVDYFVSPNWSAVSSSEWNRELSYRLGLLLEGVQPAVIVFDGTWPYQGFMNACRGYGKAKMVWSHRELHQEDKAKVFPYEDEFDLIIKPGEVGDAFSIAAEGADSKRIHVPPVCILQEDELLGRKQAREELALTENGRYALFSLGAGNINDVEAIGTSLIQRLQAAGFEVIWADNPISVHEVDLPEGVQSVSVYPLVRYLHAFDVFIGAAGYNTCCEVVQAQVPALLVPNTQTKLDDQYRRANLIAEYAPVVVSECKSESEREMAIEKLLRLADNPGNNQRTASMNGAVLAAEAIEMVSLRSP